MDYTWPSVYFAYAFFFLMFGLAVYFCIRSVRDGYWNKDSEAVKYQMFFEHNDREEGSHER